MLRGRRIERAGAGRHRGAVATRPNAGKAGNAQIGIHENRAVFRARQSFGSVEHARLNAGAPYDGAGLYPSAAYQFDSLIVRAAHAVARHNFDAALAQKLLGIRSHTRRKSGQQRRPAFDQNDTHVAPTHVRIEPLDVSKELGHLARRLNAREAAADHDQRQQFFAFEFAGVVGKFQQPNKTVAQNCRIFQRFQCEDALRDAR